MPLSYITANQSTTAVVNTFDDLFIIEGVAITSTSSGVEAATPGANFDISVTVQGSVYGTTAINFWSQSDSNNEVLVYVGSNGHVHGTSDGITIRQGDDNLVVNYGEISAQQAGVNFQGGEASVYNHGSITSFGNSGQGAIIFNSTAAGSNIREVVNTGIISGAPQSTGSSVYATISNNGGAEFLLNNSGSILGVGSTAVYSSATLTVIDNSGQINGGVFMSEGDDLYKGVGDGSVAGSIYGESGNDDLIGGSDVDVIFGGGDDDFIKGGAGDDTLYGGEGGDLIRGGAGADLIEDLSAEWSGLYGGAGVDIIIGGSGNDLIYGNRDDDYIFGGVGADEIFGGSGDDYIEGGNTGDFINGGAGDDVIYGGVGSDDLFGGAGDDALYGEDSGDVMFGGSGDDLLNGGFGKDIMTGGGGADVFEFNALGHSAVNSARDVITDFESGIDTIDLGAFGGTLTFIGVASSFSGTAGEVRFNASNSFLFVDQDGDGSSDFSIELSGVTSITAFDLIL